MSELGSAATIFDFPGTHEEIDALYQDRGWTDGLPIVPPTEAAVREFLRWTDRDPREVLGVRRARARPLSSASLPTPSWPAAGPNAYP